MKKIIPFLLMAALGINRGSAQELQNKKSEQTEVKVEKLAETSCSWDGKTLPDYPTTAPQITILRYTLPPRQRLSPHRHFIINCGVMIKGELTVIASDGREHTFKAGDAIVEMFGTVHYGENRGDGPAELIVFYAGTEGLALKEDTK